MITRKCLKCGKFTNDKEMCSYCNTPFITEKTVKEAIKLDYKKRLDKPKKELKIVILLNKIKSHKYLPIRIFGHLLNSIFLVIFFIVSAISYLIALIAA